MSIGAIEDNYTYARINLTVSDFLMTGQLLQRFSLRFRTINEDFYRWIKWTISRNGDKHNTKINIRKNWNNWTCNEKVAIRRSLLQPRIIFHSLSSLFSIVLSPTRVPPASWYLALPLETPLFLSYYCKTDNLHPEEIDTDLHSDRSAVFIKLLCLRCAISKFRVRNI